MLNIQEKRKKTKSYSDTGNRTPSCRVRGGNVSRYTISELTMATRISDRRRQWDKTTLGNAQVRCAYEVEKRR